MSKTYWKYGKPEKIVITRNYVVEKYRDWRVCKYRRKIIFDKFGFKHVLTFGIFSKSGPRGGHTKLSSLWHIKTEPKVKELLKHAFKDKIPVYVQVKRKLKRVKSYKQALKYLKESSIYVNLLLVETENGLEGCGFIENEFVYLIVGSQYYITTKTHYLNLLTDIVYGLQENLSSK